MADAAGVQDRRTECENRQLHGEAVKPQPFCTASEHACCMPCSVSTAAVQQPIMANLLTRGSQKLVHAYMCSSVQHGDDCLTQLEGVSN